MHPPPDDQLIQPVDGKTRRAVAVKAFVRLIGVVAAVRTEQGIELRTHVRPSPLNLNLRPRRSMTALPAADRIIAELRRRTGSPRTGSDPSYQTLADYLAARQNPGRDAATVSRPVDGIADSIVQIGIAAPTLAKRPPGACRVRKFTPRTRSICTCPARLSHLKTEPLRIAA